jgi:hypothetical protein
MCTGKYLLEVNIKATATLIKQHRQRWLAFVYVLLTIKFAFIEVSQ